MDRLIQVEKLLHVFRNRVVRQDGYPWGSKDVIETFCCRDQFSYLIGVVLNIRAEVEITIRLEIM